MTPRPDSSPEDRRGPRAAFFTLGCRLNQHDTAAMRADLERRGWGTDDGTGAPDVLVVNTCTVTARADQECRQLIRRLARERPAARIVVTGCYAQRAPEEVRALPGVALVLGTRERDRIAEWLPLPAGGPPRVSVAPGRARRPVPDAAAPSSFGRARALLKIQDGCDSFCSYCIVPYVRGRAQSVPRERILARARRLLDAGFAELVLTGADIGSYGRDHGGVPLLATLVEEILALGPSHRVRISSIEPNKVPDGILELVGRERRLCRHLHLPLQSGSASVLRLMRRGYGPAEYARIVERAAARGPIGLGADVIVGHPGEGEAEFDETVAFLRSLPLTYLHVFRYSPRPGTRADRVGDGRAGPGESRRRSERLRALGEEFRRRFHASLVGSTLPCIMERRGRAGPPTAMTDLYTAVRLRWDGAQAPLFDVKITGTEGGVLLGEPAAG